MTEIDLRKQPDEYLGFSIAGGITHEHVKGFELGLRRHTIGTHRFRLVITAYS
jgi:hypothetical protein